MVLHRLVYRSLTVPEQSSEDFIATHFIQLEVPLADPKQVQPPMDVLDGSLLARAMFRSGSSSNMDLLMPDRYASSNVSMSH